MVLLSKSKYLLGLQCPKQFWLKIHEPEVFPEVSASTQQIFDQGHEVGEFAKKMYPHGVDVPCEDFMGNLRGSKEALKQGKPCFEVGLCADVLYSRGDIFVPNGDGWDIVEVKSGTSVKDINIEDVAFQKYVYEKCGITIKNCYLMHINSKYVRKGEVDVHSLFVKADITDLVEKLIPSVPAKVEGMLALMRQRTAVEEKIGVQCSKPYDCPLVSFCWDFLPTENIFDLYRIQKKKAFALLDEGVMKLSEVPSSFKVNAKQQIQLHGGVHVDAEALNGFLSSLKSPVHYMDFEAYQSAIPLFDGGWPYQQVPFQYSVHVDGAHHEFLGEDLNSREKFFASLQKVIGDVGSVVVYSKSYEIARLRELAKEFGSTEWVESVVARVVDLRDPFTNFHYYNPVQKGSCSLKAVLPAVTGRDYSALSINKGKLAGDSFLKHFADPKVRADLLEYCGLDTLGMVWIVDVLKKLVKKSKKNLV